LRRFRKAVSVGAEVTPGGRQFQRRLPPMLELVVEIMLFFVKIIISPIFTHKK